MIKTITGDNYIKHSGAPFQKHGLRQYYDPRTKIRSQKVILAVLKAAILTGGTKFGLKCRHESIQSTDYSASEKVFLIYGVIINDL